ncbi:MAG TPA: vanadium-dependent haloperoxidase, partial [Thermoanaerobaculia bacterium]|nr:vanadium-dependent haloperoxidase [Thermoanaerobaculia bacterium]
QPKLGGAGDAVVKDTMVELIRMSSQLDETQEAELDISPGAIFDDSLGADDGAGRPVNPLTGAPYAPNVVKRGDYERVIAEFWADGPRSETPPGHWNVLANFVADRLSASAGKRVGGSGRIVDDLEWDVKVYIALNGAVHDAAIWAWGNKTFYDSSRPITLIRYMAGRGQSSDPSEPSYDPRGLPLVPDLVEVITSETTRPGGRHERLAGHEGEIAIRAWLGSPDDPIKQVGGVGWKLGVEWMPYQSKTFVTPPFPGYTSGHSTFSRAGAEVLAAITGSPFFPGGLGTFVARQDAFLATERGPSRTVELQWATYYDAADQAAISRRFGGIHPYYDDYPSRVAGSRIGKKAWERALELYEPSKDPPCERRPAACETSSGVPRP